MDIPFTARTCASSNRRPEREPARCRLGLGRCWKRGARKAAAVDPVILLIEQAAAERRFGAVVQQHLGFRRKVASGACVPQRQAAREGDPDGGLLAYRARQSGVRGIGERYDDGYRPSWSRWVLRTGMFSKILIANRGARSPSGSSRPAAAWASRRWSSTPTARGLDGRDGRRSVSSARRRRRRTPAAARDRGPCAGRRGSGTRVRVPVGERGLRASWPRGITFIGPNPRAIEAMGDRSRARSSPPRPASRWCRGTWVRSTTRPRREDSEDIGYPVMRRPAGGGKSIRVAWNLDVGASSREGGAGARRRPHLIESSSRARAIEIRCWATRQVVHLFERNARSSDITRDVEEAPSPAGRRPARLGDRPSPWQAVQVRQRRHGGVGNDQDRSSSWR